MNKKININVTSGNVSIGNIVQGSKNIVASYTFEQLQQLSSDFAKLRKDLSKEAKQRGETNKHIEALDKKIVGIENLLKSKETKSSTLMSRVKSIKDKFGWAFPLIIKVLKKFVPQLPDIF